MTISRQDHDQIIQSGEPAEGRINGVLRGGHVFQGRFYASAATNIGVLDAPLSQIQDLKIHNREGKQK